MVKNPPANTGDARQVNVIPESERSPGVGNDYLLQSSCPGSPMDGGTLQDTVHGVTKSWTQKAGLSN